MNAIGIDFGTTNTVLAFPERGGSPRVQAFSRGGDSFEAVRTALSFRRSARQGDAPSAAVGPWAIDEFIEAPEDTRFLQSFKSFAASPSFTDTAIFTRRYAFEDLMSTYIARLMEHANIKQVPRRLVIGRPVMFAGQNPDNGLAHRRYASALKSAGFDQVHFVLEPVAAALYYARNLERDATILVGDFGGGTSDFSVLRFSASGERLAAEALSHSGIGIAGDSFDYRIIDNAVSPLLGKYATYRSWGKRLPVPIHYFSSFSRWNELCLMQRPETLRDLRDLAKASDDGDKLQSLIDLIEGGASYELYRAVSRVKAALSTQPEARFQFNLSGVHIDKTISRVEFENWISQDLDRIGACVDTALKQANLTPDGIDQVFLTGGTSYVPAVRHLFEQRFPISRINSGEQLLSIAKGLALVSVGDDIDRWSVNA
jgi:hypothetical chaperone protein